MDSTFGSLVISFFGHYLVSQKGYPRNTVESYRDCIKLLVRYACQHLNVTPDQLGLDAFSDQMILDFLDHLEQDRGNTPRTRNQRLAAIKSFFRYLAAQDPAQLALCERICAISAKATEQKTIVPLDKSEVDAMIRATHGDRLAAVRDQALIRLLHNTGARVQELIDLELGDLHLDQRLQVRLTGKGRKQRYVPLWTDTAEAIRLYLQRRDQAGIQSQVLLLNGRGQRFTRFGIGHLLHKYATKATRTCPTLADKNVTPHVFRHTTALHLIQAGIDLPTVKEWLGHADIKTTSQYATIDMNMKRKALQTCPAPESFIPDANQPPQWHDQKIMRFLNRLSARTMLC